MNKTQVHSKDQRATDVMRTAILLFISALIPFNRAAAEHAWERPGCTQIGHTRAISIPGCVEFDVTTNACRGFCESYAVPSSEEILRINSMHVIASYGQCCNILESEDVTINVMCFDGPRRLTFKSATRCGCYHCKKD